MDPSLKKRKADENGSAVIDAVAQPNLTPEDLRKIIEPFTKDQLLDILQTAAYRHLDVLDAVRSIADRDPAPRKLFVRGLGWDTTTEGLRTLFSAYGELEEAIVILDKATLKSKGYGFVTYRHIDGAMAALREPSKQIDGRMTVTSVKTAAGAAPTPGVASVAQQPVVDVALRRVYVGNVPFEMPPERLLAHFASYGEIEEGPLGFDKATGKSRGFALFVYKTVEGARASLVDPNKVIDGVQMICKLANDNKKGKLMGPAVGGGIQPVQVQAPTGGDASSDGHGVVPPSSMPGAYPSQYGAPGGPMGLGVPGGAPAGPVGVPPGGPIGLGGPGGGISGYGAYGPGAHQAPAGLAHHHQHGFNSSLPGSGLGLSSAASHLPTTLGGSGAYGAGLGGGYSGLGGGPTPGAYGGHYGGPGSVGYTGLGASSLYRPSGGYGESAHYSLSSSAHHPPASSSPAPKGSGYGNLPPYY